MIYVENDRADQQPVLIALLAELGYEQYWHVAPLFNAANFKGATEDVTGGVISLNMLCLPEGVAGQRDRVRADRSDRLALAGAADRGAVMGG